MALLLVVGCSKASHRPTDAASPTNPDVPVSQPGTPLVERAATSICGALFRCCTTDLEAYFAPYRANDLLAAYRDRLPPATTLDEAGCRQVLGEMLDIVPLGDWARAVDAGAVELDQPAFDTCIAALDHAACGEPARTALWDSTCFGFAAPAGGSEQRSFIRRTRHAGDTCAPIRDGVGATFYGTCDPTTSFCCYAQSGAAGCQFPFDSASTPRTGTCQAVAAMGASCSTAAPLALCATGQDCDADSATCTSPSSAPLAIGETCIDSHYQELGRCQASWCDVLGSGKCTAFRDDGAACTSADECRSQHCDHTCLPDTRCDGSMPPGDAGVPDAPRADAASIDAPAGDGESCTTALDLAALSTASPLAGYTSRVAGAFGAADDYNPLMSSGKPPHCAFAYDAIGKERVYRVTLAPGDHLQVHAELADGKQAAIYLLESCPAAHWTDWDRSGACGSNEYAVGFCGIAGCDPAVLDTHYPATLDGQATQPATFWLVIDQVGGADSTGYVVDWKIAQ